MATGSLADLAAGATQSIGKYFSVISVIPSSLLVAFGYVLFNSSSWGGPLDWSQGFGALAHPGIGGLGALTLTSLGMALALHPLQFAIVQFFEGYWGNTKFAQLFRIQRILRYQALHEEYEQLQAAASRKLIDFKGDGTPAASASRARLMSHVDEATRVVNASFPRAKRDIMPTRLGNAMRRFERQAGLQYELDAPAVFPHLMLVAPPDHVAYVNDQRSQLDLAIRMSFVSLLACGMATLFLCWHGLWLLVALIPYLVSYLSYRGAIVLARQYATAVNTVVDLNRFTLYERLRLPIPASTAAERKANMDLMKLLTHSTHVDVSYVAIDSGTGGDSTSGTSI